MCRDLMTLLAPYCFDDPMSAYHGWVHTTIHDYNELLLHPASILAKAEKELENHDTFLRTLAIMVYL